MQVTETVASYSVLRKTQLDEFSHGGAGWQGLVTENCPSVKTQPCLDRDLPPRGQPSVHASAGAGQGGCIHPGRQKGNSNALSFLPLPVTNARFPGAREFLSFSENAFGLFFLGTDKL